MILNPTQHQQNGTKSAVQQKEPAILLHYSIAKKTPSPGLHTVLTYRLIYLSLQFCEADTFIYFTDEETKRHTKQTACSK